MFFCRLVLVGKDEIFESNCPFPQPCHTHHWAMSPSTTSAGCSHWAFQSVLLSCRTPTGSNSSMTSLWMIPVSYWKFNWINHGLPSTQRYSSGTEDRTLFPGAHKPGMDTEKEGEKEAASNMPLPNQQEEGVEQNTTKPLPSRISPPHSVHCNMSWPVEPQEILPPPLLAQNQWCSLNHAQLSLEHTVSSSA